MQEGSGPRHSVPSPGLLALVGGDEFKPGNEEQDRMLVAAARKGPAYVGPAAAARQGPEQAVEHATGWFRSLGLALEELPVLKPADANSKELAALARGGGFFYLVGGDPGLVARVLRDSRVWTAIFEAWRDSESHEGSTVCAMGLRYHSPIRAHLSKRVY